MVLSNVIVDIIISSRSFVFSQLDVQISAGLTKISGLAVVTFNFSFKKISTSEQHTATHLVNLFYSPTGFV